MINHYCRSQIFWVFHFSRGGEVSRLISLQRALAVELFQHLRPILVFRAGAKSEKKTLVCHGKENRKKLCFYFCLLRGKPSLSFSTKES